MDHDLVLRDADAIGRTWPIPATRPIVSNGDFLWIRR
jgi:hypothetical protein